MQQYATLSPSELCQNSKCQYLSHCGPFCEFPHRPEFQHFLKHLHLVAAFVKVLCMECGTGVAGSPSKYRSNDGDI